MKREVGVVVSRYYESLRWIEDIKSEIDVYVYDRAGDSPGMGVPSAVAWAKPKDPNDNLGGLDLAKCKENGLNVEVITIPDDPGYEASTYLHHMHTRHDQLNDYTIFIQAHPLIYKQNVIDILNNPDKIKHTHYAFESDWTYSVGRNPLAQPTTIESCIEFEPFCDTFSILIPELDYGWSPYKDNFSQVPWLEFCKNMPNSYTNGNEWLPSDRWIFGAGNQFIVSKELIHRHEAAYYKTIQEFANSYMDPNGESKPPWQQLNQGPNILEGIWKFIF